MNNTKFSMHDGWKRVFIESWFFLIFCNFIKIYRRGQMRRVMRGYRNLKLSGRLSQVDAVKQELSKTSLGLTDRHFSSAVIGPELANGEVSLRQYLLVRIGGQGLNRALLVSLSDEKSRVVYFLPKQWRKIINMHGFNVAHRRSAILWQLYVATLFFYGVIRIFKIALKCGKKSNAAAANAKIYVHFFGLSAENLPRKNSSNERKDIISWYLRWPSRVLGIEAVHHNVCTELPSSMGGISIVSQINMLPDLKGIVAFIKYSSFALYASAIAALDFLRGRWWHALLLNQAALAIQVRILSRASLAREYMFHNSDWIYRPLWTYEAERKGSKITFYFYSTNCEGFQQSEDQVPIPYGWKAASWSHYLVWDEFQASFVRRAVGDYAQVSVVGAICFKDGSRVRNKISPKSIAVFDVTPPRDYHLRLTAPSFHYYKPETVISFIRDIHGLLSDFSVDLVWKQKRKIDRLAHPVYRKFIEEVGRQSNFITIDPDVSPDDLISACVATISMPFTSTALIAKQMGKPSIYYDPIGMLRKDDNAAHGIPILSGPDELSDWLDSVIR